MKVIMKYRHEIKYLIDLKDYYTLKSRLSGILKPDIHAGHDNCYHIRSVYFDDDKNTDFISKLSGLSERKKYRIRMYNADTAYIRLEKKIKSNDVSYKLSARITKKEADSFLQSDFRSENFHENQLIEEFCLTNSLNILKPNVITDYDREAYLFDAGNVRVTLDTNLKTAMLNTDFFNRDLPMVPAIGSHQVILEVKYDAFLPSIISGLLTTSNGIQMAISKFALCKRFITLNDWEVQ